jgi:hypothetical protein
MEDDCHHEDDTVQPSDKLRFCLVGGESVGSGLQEACGGTRQRANKCAIDLHW